MQGVKEQHKDRLRILMLTQWFEPEPAFKGLAFAKALQGRGHSVEVLTGFPNYPGGKLYDGYRVRLWQRETMDGISVTRVPLYPSHDRSAIGRFANYASFAACAAVLGPGRTRRADVAYTYHPPATIGLAALALKVTKRLPILYDIQDLWPDTLDATEMLTNRFLLSLAGSWCRLVYRYADRITVLSPGFKRCLVSRGVPEKKIKVIYNWAHEPLGDACGAPEATDLGDKFVILFAGNMGAAQALDTVLQAAKKLVAAYPRILFVFVGSGLEAPRLRQASASLNLTNVRFLERRAPEQMPPLFRRADALLVHLRNDPLFAITIPSKTQAYLAAGRPILMGLRGDAADLLRGAGAGLVFEPENSDSLATTSIRLAEMPLLERQSMGARGKAYYARHLSMEAGVTAFEDELRSLARARTVF